MKLAYLIPAGGREIESACAGIAGLEVVCVPALSDLASMAGDIDALVTGATSYTADVAAALRSDAKKLRWIHFASAGYESVFQHGVPAGVQVTNSGPAWAPIVAEHAMALMLALVRHIPDAERARQTEAWIRPQLMKVLGSLEGLRLVSLGFGNIGRETARRAQGFGMKISGVARTSREEPLAESVVGVSELYAVLPQADVLLIATPLNSKTKDLIGAAELALLKPSAILINIARGGIVSEPALIEALSLNKLAGAGLDVADTEPLPAGHPFWTLKNVVITPHIAGFGSSLGLRTMADIVRENAQRLTDGRPLVHLVDLSAK